MLVARLGRTGYRDCWDLQRRLALARAGHSVPDVLLLTEHEHVYTIGRSGDDRHLLATDEELSRAGVAVVHTDRGGDITYHGPGQLVGYPILDLTLHGSDLHLYLRMLEEAVIRTLGEFGVSAGRHPSYTGVWVGGEKVCAIGVRTSRWITTHGFALNVDADLTRFDRIIPCGIFDRGVTSMRALLGRDVTIGEVEPVVARNMGAVFSSEIRWVTEEELDRLAGRAAMAAAGGAGEE
ncbi:MAG: lipB [Bacteroidetes bacterium]|nr:lipB [Bacteroidota bacterium]